MSPELDAIFTLRVADGRLVVENGWHGRWPLSPLWEDAFKKGGVTLEFARAGDR